MTVSGRNVRDFTDKERSLRVIVEADPVYEALLALFAYSGKGDHTDYENGERLANTISSSPKDLVDDIESITGCGEIALTLVGIAHDLPEPRTTGAFVQRIRDMDAVSLRALMLRNAGIKPSRGHEETTIQGAAAGDRAALDEIFADGHHDPAFARLLAREPEDTQEFVASLFERFAKAIEPLVDESQHIRERDAKSVAALARTMPPDRVVETATNGITFEMQPRVSAVLLIPSMIIRPWVVISEHATLRIFCYSVADEHLEADLDAPPAYLVDTFKALADEKRLRILRVLTEDAMTLRDLADQIDLAKSTVHHHLRVLRSAGLLRVIVTEDDKRYSLRQDAVPHVGEILEGFLADRNQTNSTEETS